MFTKPEKLLKNAGRSKEIILGWVCAAVSVTFAGLFLFLLYIIAWRNPQIYGTNDLFKTKTLVILGLILSISVGFSLLALRLIFLPNRSGLMSPLFLRIWGAFFAVMSIVAFKDASMTHSLHSAEMLGTALSMMCATFLLARRRQSLS